MLIRPCLTLLFGLGIVIHYTQADTLDFVSPLPGARLKTGEPVSIGYKVDFNGMAQLLWAKVHLLTDEGHDAGMGTVCSATNEVWDQYLVWSRFPTISHLESMCSMFTAVYTRQPCEGSIDIKSAAEAAFFFASPPNSLPHNHLAAATRCLPVGEVEEGGGPGGGPPASRHRSTSKRPASLVSTSTKAKASRRGYGGRRVRLATLRFFSCSCSSFFATCSFVYT
ncbi:MAG: hypothetical protein J3Q66DRAFT_391990, partial [Benniella sp.]